MKKFVSVVTVLAMCGTFHTTFAATIEKNIYVSPLTGSDSNNGTTREKAYKTLERAMEKIEAYKIIGANRINVILCEGNYDVNQTYSITGGNELTAVNYKAEGEVNFNGAKEISADAFVKVSDEEIKARLNDEIEDKVYVADLSELFSEFDEYHTGYFGGDAVNYYQFYHNNSEMVLARFPDTGYMSGKIPEGSEIKITIPQQKFELWKNSGSTVRVNGYPQYDWAYARTYVTDFDTENSAIDLYQVGFKASDRNKIYVFDILEELDAPGEWYIDREAKKLYYYPEKGISKTDIFEISNMKKQIIDISGIENVSFEGFEFEKTRYDAIYGTNCSNINIENCGFADIGRDAVNISGENIVVSGCNFKNIGGRGVTISGGDNDTLTESGNVVKHCNFEGVGKTFKSYHGAVNISGCGNTVINNTMKDTPHQMIGYSGTLNKILFNDISHACTDSGDMGAIYSGRSVIKRGNEIAYNYINNVSSDYSDYHLIAGIYMDDGLCGQYIHHNVIKDTNVGIHLAGGSDNSVHNNIVLDSDSAISLSQGSGKESQQENIFKEAEEYLKTNSLYVERFPTLKYIDSTKTLARGNFIHDNLIVNSGCTLYDTSSSALVFGEGERANRRYNNLIVEKFDDFKDPQNGDYEVEQESEILNDMPGLKDISMKKIGKGGSGGEYSYNPVLEEELNSCLDNLDNYINLGDYSGFSKLNESFAKAEVNGINTDEYKKHNNFIKYKDKYGDFSEFVCINVELPYNYSNIYNSMINAEGGAGFSGCFFRDDFLKNLNWEKEWTNEDTDNVLLSYNKILNKDIRFFLKVPDNSKKPENCVFKNDSTYKNNEGEYAVFDVDDGFYKTVEILANSDRPTENPKTMGVRLDYSDGSHEYFDYDLNYFANGVRQSAVTSIEATRTFKSAEKVEDLYDLSLRPAGTTGKIGHYQIPVDSNKKLQSISILNDKYDWKKDENSNYVTNDSGEYVVTQSEFTTRTNYKRTVTIYAVSLTTSGILLDKEDIFIPKNFKVYDPEGLESDFNNNVFTVRGRVIRNIETEMEGILYIAIYEGNVLIAVKKVTISGDTDVSENFEITESDCRDRKIKLFIWDDGGNMVPLYS